MSDEKPAPTKPSEHVSTAPPNQRPISAEPKPAPPPAEYITKWETRPTGPPQDPTEV